MDGQERLDGFVLDNDKIVYDRIEPITGIDLLSIVNDG